MLQSIRDKAQGWVVWTIVIAICITFALWGVNSYFYSNQSSQAVAVVNGTKITQQQFLNAYQQFKRQHASPNDNSLQSSSTLLKSITLQSMISSLVLIQDANKSGFNVDDSLIEATIAKMPVFQTDGAFSATRFRQMISGMLTSPDAFFAEMRNNILVDQLRIGIIDTSFALPNEIEKLTQLIEQERKFDYIIISPKHFLPHIQLSNQIVEDYYKTHQDEFKTPEKVSIEYLQLSVKDLSEQIQPTQEELKAFYQRNIDHYTQPKQLKLALIHITTSNQKNDELIKEKVATIKQTISPEKDFKKLFEKNNDISIKVEQAWQSTTDLSPHLKDTLSNLKTGEISPLIKTQTGYDLITLLETKSKKIRPFNEVKNEIFRTYRYQKAEQKFAELSDRLINLTYENPNSLESAAHTLKLTIQKTPLFAKEGTKEGITSHPKILAAAFSDEVLDQHNNSEPVDISNDSIVVLRVDQHKPASIRPLKEVQTKIIAQLSQEQAQEKAEKLGKQLLTELDASKTISNLLEKNGFQWKKVNYVHRYAKNIDPAIIEAAFRLPRVSNKAINAGIKLSSGDFVILSLKAIKNKTKIDQESERHKILKKQINKGFGVSDYQMYVSSLMNTAKIVKKEDSFAEIGEY